MRTDRPTGDNSFTPRPGDEEITNEKFAELMDASISMVEAIAFKEKEDSLVPVVFVHFRRIDEETGMLSDVESALIMVQSSFNSHQEKNRILREIGSNCLDHKMIPVAFFFASEAWMAVRQPDDPMLNRPPSEDPDRKECISIAGRTMTGDCKASAFIKVNRGADNEYIKDGETFKHLSNKSDGFLETPLLDQFVIGYVNRAAEKYNVKLPMK